VRQQLTQIEALCQRFHVKTLELFGSATRENFNPATSDVDFLVDFLPGPLTQTSDVYFGLLFGLEDLFGRKIDLVETKAIKNPYFWEDVADSRVPIYAPEGEDALV
jgi:predicted nucleotidyltransferase